MGSGTALSHSYWRLLNVKNVINILPKVSWRLTFGKQAKVAAHWPGVSLLLALLSVRNVISKFKKGLEKTYCQSIFGKQAKVSAHWPGVATHRTPTGRRLGLAAQISTDTNRQAAYHRPAQSIHLWDAVSTLQLCPGSAPAVISHPE